MPRKTSSTLEKIQTVEEIKIEFEHNIQYQIRLVLNDLSLIGQTQSSDIKEIIKESLINNMRTLEIILIGKIISYGEAKYKELINKKSSQYKEQIERVSKNQSKTDAEKDIEIINLQLEYLRQKFQILVMVSQMEQSYTDRLEWS